MSKYTTQEIWEERLGNKEKSTDYAGRIILKSALGNPNSHFHPTIEHIRPLAKGGLDMKENIILVNVISNQEKKDDFPYWKANEKRFYAKRRKGKKGIYDIIEYNKNN